MPNSRLVNARQAPRSAESNFIRIKALPVGRRHSSLACIRIVLRVVHRNGYDDGSYDESSDEEGW